MNAWVIINQIEPTYIPIQNKYNYEKISTAMNVNSFDDTTGYKYSNSFKILFSQVECC